MENSIKEDIKIVENYLANSAINEIDSNFFKNSGWETVDLEIPKSMQHILPDYKRVLKENEYMHNELNKQQTTINKYAKENEELKRFHIQDNKHLDFIMQHSIPIQKVKDKISERQFELQQEYKDFEDDAILIVLQELLEGRE